MMGESTLCGFRIEMVGEGTVPVGFRKERFSHRQGDLRGKL